MSAVAASPEPALAVASARLRGDALLTLAIGGLLAAAAFVAGGGLQLRPLTDVEIAVEIAAGALAAGAVVAGGAMRRPWGAVTLACFAALAALTAVSVVWAVQPADTWIEANRTLSLLAITCAGVALVRLAPDRWSSLLGGLLLACVVLCGYGLLTKVFPGALGEADQRFSRLQEPFGYWNAVGLTAALGIPACLWLGARRAGHAALSILATPALGLLVVTLLLSYPRGALLAIGIGLIVWFAIVPLRLRSAAVLIPGAGGGVLVAAWAFGQAGLSTDGAQLAERVTDGHELGLALLAMLLVLTATAILVAFAAARRAPRPAARRRAGAVLLTLVALVPILVAGELALSDRGFGGSISKAYDDLTDTSASVSNEADRLTAVGSVRARYWDEALRIFDDHPLGGVGAGGYATARLRIRKDLINVRHAHGYGVQTAADLGFAGLALSLALLVAWLVAANRSAGLWGAARRAPWTPERVGMAALATTCIVFGVHSLVDWTWFVPGTALPALLCAGWLAGRGPSDEVVRAPTPWRASLRMPPRALAAGAALALALVAVWSSWQPQRSASITASALDAAAAGRTRQALDDAARARRADPLAVDPLFARSAIEEGTGDVTAARVSLQRAVRLQPGNPEPWLALAEFELRRQRRAAALEAIGPALYLNGKSPGVVATYLAIRRLAVTA